MHKVTENSRHLATCKTERSAMISVARQIAADTSGRVLTITAPDGTATECRNDGCAIDYREVTR